jgi:NitT/TauT family transport system substrate-binding protein
MSASVLALLDGCASQPSAPGTEQERLETTTIRLVQIPGTCVAPQYLAEDLLKSDGFANVQYVKETAAFGTSGPLAAGEADINMSFAGPLIIRVDAGDPITLLAGVHVGCFELFGADTIQAISDLKGKTVAVLGIGSTQHVFLSSMLAYVNINPSTDINWVTYPPDEAIELFAKGRIDAYLAFPPTAQELHAKRIGHVVVTSHMDKPWSQYFCCMVAANREFVRKNPVATKRALRAVLRATDIASREPERAAKFMVDKGYATNYDYALKAMQDIPYNYWRHYDPTDTLRFYALRLREAGMIKSSPDEIIAKSADWRFLNELKQELQAPAASATTGGLLCRLGEPG